MKVLYSVLIIVVLMIAVFACKAKEPASVAETKKEPAKYEIKPLVGTAWDYSKKENWMYFDNNDDIDHEVDVFFFYPTSVSSEVTEDVCQDIKYMAHNANRSYLQAADTLSSFTNVYAPYYRQISFSGIMKNMTADGLSSMIANNVTRTDAYAALDYYFEHCNNGKPYILAGHSQGSATLKQVLSEYMKLHPEYLERMVAAYPIGYYFPDSWFKENPQIKKATGETDTGVLITWNTEGPGCTKFNLPLGNDNDAFVINPLNWKTDETAADVSLNKGSVFIDSDTLKKTYKDGVADATIDKKRGALVTTTYKEYIPENACFGEKSCHFEDWSLFTMNIRENAKKRIKAFIGHEVKDFTSTDYSDPKNWIMNEYNKAEKKNTKVDVINFVGTVMVKKENENGTANISDEMRTNFANGYKNGYEVYDDNVRMYVPCYRQITLDHALKGKDHSALLNDIKKTEAGKDLYDCLEYYFNNYNDGRPFILTGMSQGGASVQVVLEKFFGKYENRKYLDQMIAAYSVAYGVDKKWIEKLDYLKYTEGEKDTGVVLSWVTEGPGDKGYAFLLADPSSDTLNINPINWKLDETPAKGAECISSNINGQIVKPGKYNAQIDLKRGSIICDNNDDYVKVDGVALWGGKSLHLYELSAYWGNIKKNMHDRIDAYFANKK